TTIKAYSKFGLQDSNGKDGALGTLFAGNKAAKEKFGAVYAADLDGFDGSWWFIDSECDLKALYDDLIKHS
ncbi:hypothetical protein K6U51_10405, partial [Vibrio fluvialis]